MTSHEHNSSSAIILSIWSLVASPRAANRSSSSRRLFSFPPILALSCVIRSAGVQLVSASPRVTSRLTLA